MEFAEEWRFKTIAKIYNDFPSKFGIPRQSRILKNLKSRVCFDKKFSKDAFRGLENFSHLWLFWIFDARASSKQTVRPPRLGGNTRLGVFATRAPFRPNPIGLSSVHLESIEETAEGVTLIVSGADIRSGTSVIDIKPYLPYTDSIADATNGFAEPFLKNHLTVFIPENLLEKIPEEKRETLYAILAEDPRPAYQNNPDRIYGFPFADFEIRFSVRENILTVSDISFL